YRYENFDDYVRTKFRIFKNQEADDYAIINLDDPVIEAVLKKIRLSSNVIELRPLSGEVIGNSDGLYLSGDEIIFSLDGKLESYPAQGFGLITAAGGGRGLNTNSVENIMAVIASARLAGVERESIIKSINSFKGLSHRMEFVREAGGVTYINDSKATNPASVVRALEGLTGPVVLIAGGVDKGLDFNVLAAQVKEKARFVVLFGEAGSRINKALSGFADTVLVGGFDEAVEIAQRRAEAGDTVLLSPACSSFDEFKSFIERGEKYKELLGAF
ncbi:MAG: UDP-N-acetylmuramoyl-L-alanine--D-glutamate ligase, partial [Thermodesulfobacteriota bacterium]